MINLTARWIGTRSFARKIIERKDRFLFMIAQVENMLLVTRNCVPEATMRVPNVTDRKYRDLID